MTPYEKAQSVVNKMLYCTDSRGPLVDAVAAEIKEAIAAEREACAREMDEWAEVAARPRSVFFSKKRQSGEIYAYLNAAVTIRARKP